MVKYLYLSLCFSSLILGAEIHEYAVAGNLQGVLAMLQRGCPIDLKDQFGNTALFLAIQFGHDAVVELLLSQGANPSDTVRNGQYKKPLWQVAKELAEQKRSLNYINILRLITFAAHPKTKAALTQSFPDPIYRQARAIYDDIKRQYDTARSIDQTLRNRLFSELQRGIGLLAPYAETHIGHQALYYELHELVWRLDEKQERREGKKGHCLTCFKLQDKIADSHYISKCILREVSPYFFDPLTSQFSGIEANSIVASPISCTGGTTNFCEQHFSKQEEDFSKEFLKTFAKNLRTQVRSRAGVNISERYGSYLYYTAVLHACRLMLNNFRTRENWISRDHSEKVTLMPTILAFVDDMRRFLIDRNAKAKTQAKVMLFIDSNGVKGKNDFSYGHFTDAAGNEMGVIVHFSFNGFYFVIVDSAATQRRLSKVLSVPGMMRFDIDPAGGELSIHQLEPINWPLPSRVKELSEHSEQRRREQMGRVNRAAAKKSYQTITQDRTAEIPWSEEQDQKRFLLLPDYVTLNEQGKPKFVMKDGVYELATTELDPGENVYLFHKPKAKSHFVIGTRYSDPEHQATLGFEFRYEPTRAYVENCQRLDLQMRIDELSRIACSKPWGRDSHEPVQYYPEFAAEMIGPPMFHHTEDTPENNIVTPSIENPWHWYTDDEVNTVLRNRLREENLGEAQAVVQLAPIGGTNLGHQLRRHLEEELLRHAGLEFNRIILVPYNIGNQHWVGFLVQIEDRHVRVEYFDTLTETPIVPSLLEAELRVVYGQTATITTAANFQQFDGNACGALMVENLVQRTLGLLNQRPNFLDYNAATVRQHHNRPYVQTATAFLAFFAHFALSMGTTSNIHKSKW